MVGKDSDFHLATRVRPQVRKRVTFIDAHCRHLYVHLFLGWNFHHSTNLTLLRAIEILMDSDQTQFHFQAQRREEEKTSIAKRRCTVCNKCEC